MARRRRGAQRLRSTSFKAHEMEKQRKLLLRIKRNKKAARERPSDTAAHPPSLASTGCVPRGDGRHRFRLSAPVPRREPPGGREPGFSLVAPLPSRPRPPLSLLPRGLPPPRCRRPLSCPALSLLLLVSCAPFSGGPLAPGPACRTLPTSVTSVSLLPAARDGVRARVTPAAGPGRRPAEQLTCSAVPECPSLVSM